MKQSSLELSGFFSLCKMLLVIAVVNVTAMASVSAADKAPERYKVKFETSKGDFVVDVQREMAPQGADQFYSLVNSGFYDECRFFRVLPGFMVQFGINGNPDVQAKYRDALIKDDPVRTSNKRGTITFATSGPNSRTTQVFINFGNNTFLDDQGFSPFGHVSAGMNVVDSIDSSSGEKPNQGSIQSQGNKYLKAKYPNLDYIKKASIVKE